MARGTGAAALAGRREIVRAMHKDNLRTIVQIQSSNERRTKVARLLTEIEPETVVKVTRIEGGAESDLKASLQDLGITGGKFCNKSAYRGSSVLYC